MDDEFALCWNNFTDNITTGFQNLYDRGDLIDVTLACDGKLLHAHKIVLSICSPYFQEMFLTNPDKHPIIILKDVTFGVMCELLQFMYQGVVNVKQTELPAFMKIAQLLQIKGLTGSANNSSSSPKSPSLLHHLESNEHQTSSAGTSALIPPTISTATSGKLSTNSHNNINSPDVNSSSQNNTNNQSELKSSSHTSTSNQSHQKSHHSQSQQQLNTRMHHSENSSSSISSLSGLNSSLNLKRFNEFPTDNLSVYSKKQMKRTASEFSEHDAHHNLNSNDSIDHMNPEDAFLPPIPQIQMGVGSSSTTGGGSNNNNGNNGSNSNANNNNNNDPRFDLINVKREISEHHSSSRSISPTGGSTVSTMRTQLPHFNFDYNLYAAAAANKNLEYPNDLHLPNDFSKTANHMDIPAAGSAITMLSSTSLLHGNCIFNRNNTVATQQGMKTYWLCKSYRISMCRARCITHQGRVISATGVHNHPPHIKNNEIVNMSLLQFPQGQQSQHHHHHQQQQQQHQTISSQQQQQQHQLPGMQQQQLNINIQSPNSLSVNSLSAAAATSLNHSIAASSALTLANSNLNTNNLPNSLGIAIGASGSSGSNNNNNNNNNMGINLNQNDLGSNSNSVTQSSNLRLAHNSNLHIQQSNFQAPAAHLSHLNHLVSLSNTNNFHSSSGINSGNNMPHHQVQQQQQHAPTNDVMQSVLTHQNTLMHLSNLPVGMLSVTNSLHQQQLQQQQQQLSPIEAHQQQPSHHSSLQHLQQQISQLSPSQLTVSPTLHAHHRHHHHNLHNYHNQTSAHTHHHQQLNLQTVSDIESGGNNDENNSNLNSPQNRHDSNRIQLAQNHETDSPTTSQSLKSNQQNQMESPTTLTNQQQTVDENNLTSEIQQHHRHHHHHDQSILIDNEKTNTNHEPNDESHHENETDTNLNNNNDNNDLDDDDSHNENPSSNHSSMLATITISPGQHHNFKIEDM